MFAAIASWIDPLPVPDALLVMVIHGVPVADCQLHPAAVVTWMLLEVAAAFAVIEVGLADTVQPDACVTVTV